MSWGPSPEYADWWYVVSWRGIIWSGVFTALAATGVVIFTALQFWSDGIRDDKTEHRSKAMEVQFAEANARAKEAELKLEQLRQKTLPRSLSLDQRKVLSEKLASFKGVRGTLTPSPSTPEGERFADELLIALHQAGWDIKRLPGTATATILFPTGVVVLLPLATGLTMDFKDGRPVPPPGPWSAFVDGLNEVGIATSVTPWAWLKDAEVPEIVISSER